MESKVKFNTSGKELFIRNFDGIVISDPFLTPNGDKIRFYSTAKNKVIILGFLDNGKKITVNYIGPINDDKAVYSVVDFITGIYGKAKALAGAGLDILEDAAAAGNTAGSGTGSCQGVSVTVVGNVAEGGINLNCSGTGGDSN